LSLRPGLLGSTDSRGTELEVLVDAPASLPDAEEERSARPCKFEGLERLCSDRLSRLPELVINACDGSLGAIKVHGNDVGNLIDSMLRE
jgi:hypothetical protein